MVLQVRGNLFRGSYSPIDDPAISYDFIQELGLYLNTKGITWVESWNSRLGPRDVQVFLDKIPKQAYERVFRVEFRRLARKHRFAQVRAWHHQERIVVHFYAKRPTVNYLEGMRR